MEEVQKQSKWVLRMNTCAFLVEQLRIMELFGGCTVNLQDIFVPAVVYHALERMMKVTVPGQS